MFKIVYMVVVEYKVDPDANVEEYTTRQSTADVLWDSVPRTDNVEGVKVRVCEVEALMADPTVDLEGVLR